MTELVLGPFPVLRIGSLRLPTYNVFLSLLLLGLVYYVYRRSIKQNVSGVTAIDLFLIVVSFGSIGARLFHVVCEEPVYYLQNPIAVFYIWQGGFVFYGGLVFGLFSGWVALKIKKQSFNHWLDFFTPVVSLAYSIGRIACFLTGCCYGKICDLPWAYAFRTLDLTSGATGSVHRHPTQMYAVVCEFITYLLVLRWDGNAWFQQKPGRLFATWLVLHALTRFIIEFFRDDERGLLYIVGWPVSPAMIISVILSIAGFVFIRRSLNT